MKLTPHFTLEELLASDLAVRKGIDNTPAQADVQNLTRLAQTLELVRTVLGAPLRINSGYRSLKLNAAVGGAKTSAHLEGRAADFTCAEFGTPLEIATAIVNAKVIEFDQLIQEGTWVHIGISKPGDRARNQVLTAKFINGKATYREGL